MVTSQAETRAHDEAEVTVPFEASGTTNGAQTTSLPPATTTIRQPLNDRGMDLNTMLPIGVTFIVILVLILCLRYHLHSASYKSWAKRLRRSRRRQENDEPVDEEMFKPPPDYEMAVGMPRPCRCAVGCPENCSDNSENECNVPTNETESSSTEPQSHSNITKDCKCICHSEEDNGARFQPVGDPDPQGSINISDSREPCTIYLDSDSPEVHKGPFVILEHVQKMAQNPEVPPHYLPSYEDYIEEFPDNSYYV